MFWTILTKEIREGLCTPRFAITAVLCLTLIPLGIYVNLGDYELREQYHAEALRLQRERAQSGVVGAGFEGQAFRQPSLLSVFSTGLETALPSRVVTSRDGITRISSDQDLSSPHGRILGRFDLMSFVTVVLSLLAFTFTHGTIAGEKEKGTLRLLLNAPAGRGQILFGKLVGNYMLFSAPLLLGIGIGLLVISRSGSAAVLWGDLSFQVALICLFTLLFVLCIFSVGMFVSVFTRTSGSAILALVFVWTLLVLTVPRLAPMVAEAVLPARPRHLVEMDKVNARARLEQEYAGRYEELFGRVLTSRGLHPGKMLVPVDAFMTPSQRQAVAEYRTRVVAIEQEYDARLGDTLAVLEGASAQASRRQSRLATILSRLSPVGSYAALIGAVTGTGIQEWERLLEGARAYQHRMDAEFYCRWKVTRLGRNLVMTSPTDGSCEQNVDRAVLTAVFPGPPLGAALGDCWADFGLLLLMTCGACLGAYIRFQRYDAR